MTVTQAPLVAKQSALRVALRSPTRFPEEPRKESSNDPNGNPGLWHGTHARRDVPRSDRPQAYRHLSAVFRQARCWRRLRLVELARAFRPVFPMGPDMQASRESLVAAPVWAYPWVHRATRVALDLIEGRSVARESSRGPRSNLRGASTCVKSEIQVHIKNLGLIFSFCSRGAL